MIKQLINLSKCKKLLQQHINKDFNLQTISLDEFHSQVYILSTIKEIKKIEIINKKVYYIIKEELIATPENFFMTNIFNYKDINNNLYCPINDILNEDVKDIKYIKIFKHCIENIDLNVNLNDSYFNFTYDDLIEIQKCVKFLSNNNNLKDKIKYTILNNNKPLSAWFVNRKD